MKFLVANYCCLQNPWLGGCRPQIPVLSVLCPQLNLLNPTPRTKFLGTPLVGAGANRPGCKAEHSPPSSSGVKNVWSCTYIRRICLDVLYKKNVPCRYLSLECFIDIILPIALWTWGRLSLQQKWVPGAFPGGKGGWCLRLTTYHHPVPLSRNLGILTYWNPLGHSRLLTGQLYLTLPLQGRSHVICQLVLEWSCLVNTNQMLKITAHFCPTG